MASSSLLGVVGGVEGYSIIKAVILAIVSSMLLWTSMVLALLDHSQTLFQI